MPSGDAENQFRLQVFNKVKIMSQVTAAARTTTATEPATTATRNENNNANAGLPLSLQDKTRRSLAVQCCRVGIGVGAGNRGSGRGEGVGLAAVSKINAKCQTMRVVRGGKSKRQQRQAKVKCTKRQMKRKRNWGHCVAYGGGGQVAEG